MTGLQISKKPGSWPGRLGTLALIDFLQPDPSQLPVSSLRARVEFSPYALMISSYPLNAVSPD